VSEAPPPVVAVRGLVTRFGSHAIHDGLDLDIRKGEVLGIVGGSGTGKSVLLRTIIGLKRPEGGRVEVLGQDIHAASDEGRRAIESRMGVLFQQGALFGSLCVGENVAVPLREHTEVRGTLLDEIVRLKIDLAGLPPDAAPKLPAELSGGMIKRAALARALALDPEILFLDEPTAGLDPIGASEFDQLIRDLQRALGLTVVMVTHDLDTLHAICDRIAVLIDKRVKVGTMAELLAVDHPWFRAYFHGPRGRAAQGAAG